MRCNVYNEELTREVAVVHKDTMQQGNTVRYYAVRFYLKSHSDLHDTPYDDDRSAVTFWFGDQDICLRLAQAAANILGTHVTIDGDPVSDAVYAGINETP